MDTREVEEERTRRAPGAPSSSAARDLAGREPQQAGPVQGLPETDPARLAQLLGAPQAFQSQRVLATRHLQRSIGNADVARLLHTGRSARPRYEGSRTVSPVQRQPAAPAAAPARRTLSRPRGSRGADVEDVQRRLNEFGADPQLVVDGIFGRKTEAAVIAFQREYGLSPDGVVGKQTWNTLLTGAAPRTPTAPSGETEAARPCGVGDTLVLTASWSLANARLQLVIPALENVAATGVIPDDLKAKLETHFRIPRDDAATQRQRVDELIAGYRKIAATLASLPATRDSFSCGGAECAPGDYAYVRIGSPVRIFMCDVQRDWRNLLRDPLDLAATWIHELGHELLTTSDHGGGGYYNHRSTCPVGMAPARNNSDSWANFAVEYP